MIEVRLQAVELVVWTPQVQLDYVSWFLSCPYAYLSPGSSLKQVFPLEKPRCFNQWLALTFRGHLTHWRRWWPDRDRWGRPLHSSRIFPALVAHRSTWNWVWISIILWSLFLSPTGGNLTCVFRAELVCIYLAQQFAQAVFFHQMVITYLTC